MITKLAMFWVAISIFFEGFGDYFAKKWSITSYSMNNFVLAVVTYNLMIVTWLFAVKNSKEISIIGTVWLLLGHGCLILVGAVIFKETLTTAQWIGICLAAVALILMTL